MIFAVPGEPANGGNITVTHRVAVKLYIAVPGERIELIELGVLSGPRLIDTGPATFELSVSNRGNVHRRFAADTQLLATDGDNDLAFENFTVLGDSTRVVEAVWPDRPLLCWCTIEVEVDDGQGNLLTVSTWVIAFPLRLSLALLALTVGLAILAVGRRRHRTARSDRQLEAARREGANTPTATIIMDTLGAEVAMAAPIAIRQLTGVRCPSCYAALGAPNQVVSASGSPASVGSPTQAT